MIYTIGDRDLYERVIKESGDKAKGGSVWKTREEAEARKNAGDPGRLWDFEVYGVEADWDKDVKEGPDFGTLSKKAKLVKL